MTDLLLQPFSTKRLTFKNRLVHAPTTMNMSDPLGHVTPKCVGAYESLAAGGFGAVCVGATCVRHDGLINERMLGMYDDTYVIGHRDLVEVIHNNGALAGIQLFYGGSIPGLGATHPIPDGEGWIPGTVAWGPSKQYPVGNKNLAWYRPRFIAVWSRILRRLAAAPKRPVTTISPTISVTVRCRM